MDNFIYICAVTVMWHAILKSRTVLNECTRWSGPSQSMWPKENLNRNVRKCTLWRAPNEHSNQPAHARSLIRVFVVRTKKLCILGYPKCSQDSDQTVQMRRLMCIFDGRLCPKVLFKTLRPIFLRCASNHRTFALTTTNGKISLLWDWHLLIWERAGFPVIG